MTLVTLLATGGTIACRPDDAGQVVPALGARELVARAGEVPGVEVEAVDAERLSSWRVTPAQMLDLATRASEALTAGSAGVVVTHGTDTLEETAALLDLVVRGPVVVTGAMRHDAEPGADGPANLADALAVAASPAAAELGCLVVFAGQVHAAGDVRKVHSSRPDAFASPQSGPLGAVLNAGASGRQVSVWSRPRRRPLLAVRHADARVPLLTTAAGMSGDLVAAVVATGVDGLVVEGTGLGHVPADWVPALAEAAARVPVLLTTRTGAGPVAAVYGGAGGGHELAEVGLIQAGYRSGRRARIELICALGAGLEGDELVAWLTA